LTCVRIDIVNNGFDVQSVFQPAYQGWTHDLGRDSSEKLGAEVPGGIQRQSLGRGLGKK